MKILIPVHKFWPSKGGTQTLSYNIAKQLVMRGHDVTVYTSMTSSSAVRETIDGILIMRFHRDDIRISRPWYITPKMSLKMLGPNTKNFDIVHSFHFVSFQAALSSFVRKLYGVPFVLTASYHPWHGVYEETVAATVMRSADSVIAQCSEEREALSCYVDKKMIVEIPCGIDVETFSQLPDGGSFRERYALKASDKLVLYVGALGGRKSISDLVRQMPWILQRVPSAKLVLVGGGSEIRYMQALVSQMGMSEQVRVIGSITESEKTEAYASADVFAFPSEHESFGISLLEAAAAGVPIVSRRVGVAPEIVEEGVTGHLSDAVDHAFANKVSKVLLNDSYAINAKQVRNRILEKYAWTTVVVSIERLYSSLV